MKKLIKISDDFFVIVNYKEELVKDKQWYLGYPNYNTVHQWNMGTGIHEGKSTWCKIVTHSTKPLDGVKQLDIEKIKKLVDVKHFTEEKVRQIATSLFELHRTNEYDDEELDIHAKEILQRNIDDYPKMMFFTLGNMMEVLQQGVKIGMDCMNPPEFPGHFNFDGKLAIEKCKEVKNIILKGHTEWEIEIIDNEIK